MPEKHLGAMPGRAAALTMACRCPVFAQALLAAALTAVARSNFGRPVLVLGTETSAARKAVSDIALNVLMPARRMTLFFAGCVRRVARRLSSARAVYSAFGIVKLSRTNFCLVFEPSVAFLAAGAVDAALAGAGGFAVVVRIGALLAVRLTGTDLRVAIGLS